MSNEKKELKKVRGVATFIIFVVVIVIVVWFFGKDLKDEKDPKRSMTPEQARAEKIQKQFSSLNGQHPTVNWFIKTQMSNPRTFKHVSTKYVDKGTYLWIKTIYRKNVLMGGMITHAIVMECDLKGNVKKIISESQDKKNLLNY